MESYDDGQGGGPALWVVGGFSLVGGNLFSPHVARWYGACTHTIDPMCFGDGTFAYCPCNNFGSSLHGCGNSAAPAGALLSASGTTVPDTLVLSSSSEPFGATTIFLQSSEIPYPRWLGGGILCLGGQMRRMYVGTAFFSTAQAPRVGDLSITQRSAQLGDPLFPGSVRYYQAWYRDPNSCTAAPDNVSNGLRVVW
ncbi:MAG: hypothetical protein IPJ19_01630 [Planctomycetes bacterium]|nr:hypothetical protein [Planctomycetota bacterium]